MQYTNGMLEKIKDISLSSLASAIGYTVVRKGHLLSLKEMDSMMIYNDRTWKRFSNKGTINGGTTIDFVMEFMNMEFVEAVEYLSEKYNILISLSNPEYEKYRNENKNNQNVEIVLPEKEQGKWTRTYAYLMKNRKINYETINYFVKNKLLYESKERHNIVFLGYDKNKKIQFASQRGTYDLGGKVFKGDVLGNNKNYGINITNNKNNTVHVFEAAIDLMSYCQLENDFDKTNKLALGMVADNPLETFLKDYPNIEIIELHLDNDEAGNKAAQLIKTKYEKLNYKVNINVVEFGKDVNEYLKIKSENVELTSQNTTTIFKR